MRFVVDGKATAIHASASRSRSRFCMRSIKSASISGSNISGGASVGVAAPLAYMAAASSNVSAVRTSLVSCNQSTATTAMPGSSPYIYCAESSISVRSSSRIGTRRNHRRSVETLAACALSPGSMGEACTSARQKACWAIATLSLIMVSRRGIRESAEPSNGKTNSPDSECLRPSWLCPSHTLCRSSVARACRIHTPRQSSTVRSKSRRASASSSAGLSSRYDFMARAIHARERERQGVYCP